MRNKNKWLFITPALLIMVLSRYILAKYGQDANNKIGFIVICSVLLLFIGGITYFFIKKYFWLSIGLVTMIIPMIVCIIGLYKENYPLMIKGLIALLLIMVGWYIFLRLYLKNKNK
ncbi:hypothetical protein [Clostridium sp.]|uniref:hypothetical protein n=1 Tax=Clostridium sp. TaxID=1506 RepID=UPI003217D50C